MGGIYQDETTADLRFWNTDNRLTITDEGNVGIGTTSPDATIHVVNTNADVSLEEYQSSGTGPQLKFYKARGSALEPQSISSGTEIGKIKFSGYGETDFKQSALILARSESAFSRILQVRIFGFRNNICRLYNPRKAECVLVLLEM